MEHVDKVTLFGEFENNKKVDDKPRLDVISMEERDSEPPEEENFAGTMKLRIIQVASGSKGFFRHQQIGDPDLTKQDKISIVTDLLENKPSTFLQRFGQFLSEDHLTFFEDMSDQNYEVGFYLKEARQKQCKYVQEHRVKNRRFQAMQKMISAGDEHFSEESMRQRNPLLYGQLIGQFLTDEERSVADRPDMTNCSLANIIMEHMDIDRERNLKKRLQGNEEEEFDTDSEDEDLQLTVSPNPTGSLDDGEKNALKREFVQASYQSFIAGLDAGVDYSLIDEDSDLDDLNLENRENEERYFDEDDPDE